MRAIAAIREFKLSCGDAFILGLVIGTIIINSISCA